jgi:hypothetical protein
MGRPALLRAGAAIVHRRRVLGVSMSIVNARRSGSAPSSHARDAQAERVRGRMFLRQLRSSY